MRNQWAVALTLVAITYFTGASELFAQNPGFVRGDANGDGGMYISDGVGILWNRWARNQPQGPPLLLGFHTIAYGFRDVGGRFADYQIGRSLPLHHDHASRSSGVAPGGD